MKLYSSATSPYVRKIHIALHEMGQFDAVEIVPAKGTPLAPGSLPTALNPLGKIPLLERADGPALYDSRVILRYLDETFGGGLYPDAPRLWETLTLEATADGILDAAILIVYEARLRPEALQFGPWKDAQTAKITRALDAVEARWMAYLSGPFDAGQIALAGALGYLEFRDVIGDWKSGRPSLAAWFADVAARESFAATVPQE